MIFFLRRCEILLSLISSPLRKDGSFHSRGVRFLFWLFGFAFCVAAYLVMLRLLGLDLLAHSPYDSYTLQAMRWREGEIALKENIPYLELAVYEGRYWVSFPPFPAVPMYLLTFVFGDLTPSRVVVLCYWLASYCVAFHLAGRMKASAASSMLWAVLAVCGCNLFEVCLFGDVWNMAQALCLLLSLSAVDLLAGESRTEWGFGLFCLALSVGCRPFQAFYVLPAVYWTAVRVWKEEPKIAVFLRRMTALLAAPALFAALLCFYNWYRFGNIFEFGHNYLPEFAEQSEYGQFSFHYMGQHFRDILRMPWWENGYLRFPTAYGFAFWLANPIFVLAVLRIPQGFLWKKKWQLTDTLLIISLTVHFLALLMHKSFGGWQFGTRYLCDLEAWLLLFCLRRDETVRFWEGPVFLWAVAFNLYGAWAFHTLG